MKRCCACDLLLPAYIEDMPGIGPIHPECKLVYRRAEVERLGAQVERLVDVRDAAWRQIERLSAESSRPSRTIPGG